MEQLVSERVGLEEGGQDVGVELALDEEGVPSALVDLLCGRRDDDGHASTLRTDEDPPVLLDRAEDELRVRGEDVLVLRREFKQETDELDLPLGVQVQLRLVDQDDAGSSRV
ncbi:hypothetical protein [Nannocystis pusilla]|uniref:hypothetical protein n=1 Tax=Nannocystis pusilla TaxID=889268 RepID=UPI0021E10602|nr:hypothetical protein [Nannocystis pusilla]